jgi:phosphoribosyl 1,2-cyclic phosphodiesterase
VETGVAISFAILGSGSSGNSTVVALHGQTPHEKPTYLLIDAGLSPLATRRRLAAFGLALTDISGILVTHFDTDHFGSTWPGAIEKLELTVYVHHRHRRAANAMLGSVRRVRLFRDELHVDGMLGTGRTAIAPHDDHGTVSYVLDHRNARLGFATDLGRFTKELRELFMDVDGLAIESNYDPDLQRSSARPAFLKRRIMGGQGHLSNIESIEAVCAVAGSSKLQHIAALHLSQQCNEPSLITSLYAREAGDLLGKLTITNQRCATPMLHVAPDNTSGSVRSRIRVGEQRVLF